MERRNYRDRPNHVISVKIGASLGTRARMYEGTNDLAQACVDKLTFTTAFIHAGAHARTHAFIRARAKRMKS